jgi:hypothetical protein
LPLTSLKKIAYSNALQTVLWVFIDFEGFLIIILVGGV